MGLVFLVIMAMGGSIALYEADALYFEDNKPKIDKVKLEEIKEVRYEFND